MSGVLVPVSSGAVSQWGSFCAGPAAAAPSARLRLLEALTLEGLCSGGRLVQLARLASGDELVTLARQLVAEEILCVAGNRLDPNEIRTAQFAILPSARPAVSKELRQFARG